MNRARQVVFGELALLAHVHQSEFLAAIDFLFDFFDIGLAHARFGVVHDLKKAGRMLCLGHGVSLVEVQYKSYQRASGLPMRRAGILHPREAATFLASRAGTPSRSCCVP